MPTRWQVEDARGRPVELAEAGWSHIIEHHRDDMAERESDIRLAVEAPDHVNADVDYAQREVCYRSLGRGRRFVRVVIHYQPVSPQGSWRGRIITAHLTFREKRGEVRLWP